MELVLVVDLMGNETEDDETADDSPDGGGQVDGDGGKEETSETRNQELDELGTEESEGNTTSEVDEGSDTVSP